MAQHDADVRGWPDGRCADAVAGRDLATEIVIQIGTEVVIQIGEFS
ncbi:hypothetical protein [Sorangium sp. So ce1099]